MQKRKRREYRMLRKAQFQQAIPGYSLYEGRTRGKRQRYTYDNEEDEDEDEDASGMSESMLGARRATRNSGVATPADAMPTVTASGRQVRSRFGGVYGESLVSGQTTGARASPATENYERSEGSEAPHGATRASRRGANHGWQKGRKHIETYNSVDEMDDEDDASSSGGEWDGGDEEEPDIVFVGQDDDSEDASSDEDGEPKSLVVKLKIGKPAAQQNQETWSVPLAPRSPIENSTEGAAKFDVAPNAVPASTLNGPTPNGSTTVLPPTAPPIAGLNGFRAAAPVVPAAVTEPIMNAEPMKQKVQTTLPFFPQHVPAVHPAPTQPATIQTTAQEPTQEPMAPQTSAVPGNDPQQFPPIKPQPQHHAAPVTSG